MKKHFLCAILLMAAITLLRPTTATAQYVISLSDGQQFTWSDMTIVKGDGEDT